MLFKNHQMIMVTNQQLLNRYIYDFDYNVVAGITDQQIPGVLNASVLMPPTELLMAWADGDNNAIINGYRMYLNSQCPDELIVSLLAALTKKNVILYMPKDDFNVYGNIFLDYLNIAYGIKVGFLVEENPYGTPFMFDSNAFPLIISKFYMMDVMSANDFLNSYPPNTNLYPFVVNKLAAELRPYGRNQASFQQYAEFFEYDINKRHNVNKMIVPITIIDKEEKK